MKDRNSRDYPITACNGSAYDILFSDSPEAVSSYAIPAEIDEKQTRDFLSYLKCHIKASPSEAANLADAAPWMDKFSTYDPLNLLRAAERYLMTKYVRENYSRDYIRYAKGLINDKRRRILNHSEPSAGLEESCESACCSTEGGLEKKARKNTHKLAKPGSYKAINESAMQAA